MGKLARIMIQLHHLTPDGNRLRYTHYPATDGPARGVLVFMQGRAEFLEKYADLFDGLAHRGFDVWSMDWRGQGGSDRELSNPHKGHIDDFATYLRDFDDWLEKVVGLGPDDSFTLMGHSMGGHLAIRYCLENPWRVRSLLACAPMLDVFMPFGIKPISGGVLAVANQLGQMERYAPTQGDFNLTLFSFLGNALTQDDDRFDAMKKAMRDKPDLQLGGVTLGWMAASLKSMRDVRRTLQSKRHFPCPARVLLAGKDRIVVTETALAVLAHLDNLDVELIPDARHEITQELPEIRARMWTAIDEVLVPHALDKPVPESAV